MRKPKHPKKKHKIAPAAEGDPHTHAPAAPEIHAEPVAPKKAHTAESLDARWAKCIAKFPPVRTKWPSDESREAYIAEHR